MDRLEKRCFRASKTPYGHDAVANNKAYSNKNEKHSVSDVGVAPIVGARDQQTNLCLRFYDIKECKTLSNEDKQFLHEWRLSNPNESSKSKKRTLDDRKSGMGNQHKRQKRNNINNDIKSQIKSATDKLFKDKLKEIYGDNSKKVSFKGNIKEKEDRSSYIVDAVVVPEKMECPAFVGKQKLK